VASWHIHEGQGNTIQQILTIRNLVSSSSRDC
jgi:hypothetical protein